MLLVMGLAAGAWILDRDMSSVLKSVKLIRLLVSDLDMEFASQTSLPHQKRLSGSEAGIYLEISPTASQSQVTPA
jgi:hypothetical protein